MFFIPGEFISVVTFPGVIVHEAAHLLFCRLSGVAVYDVCFFRFGNPAGYVIHEPIKRFRSALLICLGPLLVNSLLCMLICFPAFIPFRLYDRSEPLALLLLWLGISIGMHAFPSTGDAQSLWHGSKAALKQGNVLAALAFPLVGLIYLANILSVVWFDAAYAAGIGLGLPELLLQPYL